jgi:AmpD protein
VITLPAPAAKPTRRLDARGWVARAPRCESPNHDSRPADAAVTLLVVHGISLPPGRFGGPAIIALFTNTLAADAHPYFAAVAHLRVSAHFLISRSGALLQFVACADRAWHAGASRWRGRERCNDFSVGVELEGTDDLPYTGAQYRRLARLVALLRRRYPITDIAGHCEIAPERKTDPGRAFDWTQLAALLGTPRG